MSEVVTFTATLIPADVIEMAIDSEKLNAEDELENAIEFMTEMVLPILYQDEDKIGTARNFHLTHRGLQAELTTLKKYQDCFFSVTSLERNAYVGAYGGFPDDDDCPFTHMDFIV